MSKLLAILATIKELLNLWKWAVDKWDKYQDGKISKRYQEREKSRNQIKADMRLAIKEGNDEKLKDLLRNLNDLNSK